MWTSDSLSICSLARSGASFFFIHRVHRFKNSKSERRGCFSNFSPRISPRALSLLPHRSLSGNCSSEPVGALASCPKKHGAGRRVRALSFYRRGSISRTATKASLPRLILRGRLFFLSYRSAPARSIARSLFLRTSSLKEPRIYRPRSNCEPFASDGLESARDFTGLFQSTFEKSKTNFENPFSSPGLYFFKKTRLSLLVKKKKKKTGAPLETARSSSSSRRRSTRRK